MATIIGNLLLEAFARAVDDMQPAPDCPGVVSMRPGALLEDLIDALPGAARDAIIEESWYEVGVPAETVLDMSWTGMISGAEGFVSIYSVALRDGRCAFVQSGALDLDRELLDEPTTVIAGSDGTADAQEAFLEQLIRTNGEAFGIALMEHPPDSLGCDHQGDRSRLVDLFVECFEAARAWGSDPFEALRELLDVGGAGEEEEDEAEEEAEEAEEPDKRELVSLYLSELLGPVGA